MTAATLVGGHVVTEGVGVERAIGGVGGPWPSSPDGAGLVPGAETVLRSRVRHLCGVESRQHPTGRPPTTLEVGGRSRHDVRRWKSEIPPGGAGTTRPLVRAAIAFPAITVLTGTRGRGPSGSTDSTGTTSPRPTPWRRPRARAPGTRPSGSEVGGPLSITWPPRRRRARTSDRSPPCPRSIRLSPLCWCGHHRRPCCWRPSGWRRR